jgi:hypothetical protein
MSAWCGSHGARVVVVVVVDPYIYHAVWDLLLLRPRRSRPFSDHGKCATGMMKKL